MAEEPESVGQDVNFLTDAEKSLVKKKLIKFVCGTCDMGANAPAHNVESLPHVAELLVTKF